MLRERPATLADAEWLAPRLRAEDKAEVLAAGSTSPLQALQLGLQYSLAPSVGVDEDDRPVVFYGACPTPEPLVGSIWLLASDDIHKHRVSFLRQSRGKLREAHERFPVLFNYVDERNAVHIQWLRWMGFTFLQRHPSVGPEGRPFLEFMRFNPCAIPLH